MKQFYEALRKARNISQESVDDKYYLKSYKDNIYGEMPVFFFMRCSGKAMAVNLSQAVEVKSQRQQHYILHQC